MLTRKMSSKLNTDTCIKTIQDDLNKSLKLNQQLIDEQNESEKDFQNILDVNAKLKSDMVRLVEQIEILEDKCTLKEKLIMELQKEYSNYESVISENNRLQKRVQKLTTDIKEHTQEITSLNEERDKLRQMLTEEKIKTNKLKLQGTCYKPNEVNIEEVSKELKQIRNELKFKNAEIKTLRKKGKKQSTELKTQHKQCEELECSSDLQEKHDKILKEQERNIKELNDNEQKLKEKISILENTCEAIRNSFDNLSIENYKTQQEKCDLINTIDQIGHVLKEQDTCDIITNYSMPSVSKPTTSKAANIKSHSNSQIYFDTVVIGDECIRGMGVTLKNNSFLSSAVCCQVFSRAPINILLEKVKEVAETQKPKAIVLATRNPNNRYVEDIMSLNETLKLMNIRLVCLNIEYNKNDTTQNKRNNRIIYNRNIRLHNYCVYDNNIQIINMSSIQYKMNDKDFKSLVTEYIVTLSKNFFQLG